MKRPLKIDYRKGCLNDGYFDCNSYTRDMESYIDHIESEYAELVIIVKEMQNFT